MKQEINNSRMLPMSQIAVNNGQMDGVRANPRQIKGEKFDRLKASIERNPEMLALRELLVYEHGGKYIVIGGNMRYRACKELGYKQMPCKIIPPQATAEQLNAYIILDNSGFGDWDWDALANEWDSQELTDWGVDVPNWDDEASEEEIERKAREFQERMDAGDIDETDEEYQQFLEKFKQKKTTDDCYTPTEVYDAVAKWVSDTYNIDRRHFERPFYPGGDYKNAEYPKGCVVVDNPPFSILAEILQFYTKKGIKFFLFAPSLTLFSSSSSCTALPVGVSITYENGANVATSFLTNLEPITLRLRSCPTLYDAVKTANDNNLSKIRKELPKYSYPDYVITATRVCQFSRYGIDFAVPVSESKVINRLDSQVASGKAIYGKGYLVSERVKAEREKAEREKAERDEREKSERWELSQRELDIIKSLSQ